MGNGQNMQHRIGRATHGDVESHGILEGVYSGYRARQDTVVIMDRVRENSRLYVGRMSYAQMINNSITETYTRSINTGTTTLLGIVVLLIFGGRSILDFTLIFFVGLLAGTWSSIYIAAPLLVIWKNAENKYGKNREIPVQVATVSGPSVTVQVPSQVQHFCAQPFCCMFASFFSCIKVVVLFFFCIFQQFQFQQACVQFSFIAEHFLCC